jgi:hypothetical protein
MTTEDEQTRDPRRRHAVGGRDVHRRVSARRSPLTTSSRACDRGRRLHRPRYHNFQVDR